MNLKQSKRQLKKAILAEALRIFREERPQFPVQRVTLHPGGPDCFEYQYKGSLGHLDKLMEQCRKFELRAGAR